MNAHELKTDPDHIMSIRRELKTIEVRKNDRDFRVGDILILKPYDRKIKKYIECHGPDTPVIVKHILPGNQYGIKRGYIAMSIQVIKEPADYRDAFSYLSENIRVLGRQLDKWIAQSKTDQEKP